MYLSTSVTRSVLTNSSPEGNLPDEYRGFLELSWVIRVLDKFQKKKKKKKRLLQ